MSSDLERAVAAKNARIIFFDLRGYGCEGAARKSKDGYIVLIDYRLTRKRAIEVLEHEMMHILLGHLDYRSGLTYEEKEAEVEEEWLW